MRLWSQQEKHKNNSHKNGKHMSVLKRHYSSFFALFLLAAMLLGTSAVSAASSQEAAYDERGQFIADKHGNCVRTKWSGDLDPCAPPPPPEPEPVPVAAPAPAPKPVIKLEQRTVFFNFDSAELNDEAVQKLTYLAQVINSSRAIADVSVVGYADEMGKNDYNQALSEARVKSVESFLDQRSRMDTKAASIRALGELSDMPQCSKLSRSKKIECLQPQRRVEVEFKYQVR
jgi:outer membrane protein OmpA-like peptidoglycan-associated protein